VSYDVAVGSESLRLFYSTSLDTDQNTWQLQQRFNSMGRVSRTSFGGGGSASAAAFKGGLRMGLAALHGLTHAATVHGEVLVKITDTARLLADLVAHKVRPHGHAWCSRTASGISVVTCCATLVCSCSVTYIP
jgi:hypothetical protein